jgi:integrase
VKAKKSSDHIADLKYRCGRFKEAFNVDILDVTATDLRKWLDGMKLSPRSLNNFRSTIGSLFNFAKKRKWLPKDHDEILAVDVIDEGEKEICIHTPKELHELISRSDPRFVPFLVIGAFAGLRSSEIERMDWKHIKGDFIEVQAKKGKRKRRLVPILPNLAKWLAPYRKESGRVVPFESFGEHQEKICEERRDESGKVIQKKLEWKTNALRHSFGSYRTADIKNVNQVSLEMGNEPEDVIGSYREVVTENVAKAWFSIEPESPANLLPMKVAP